MTATSPPLAPDAREAASPGGEAAVGVAFLVFGAVLVGLARAIDLPDRVFAVSPRIWPEALGAGIAGLSILQIVMSFVRTPKVDEDLEPTTRLGIMRLGGFVLAILAFGLLWFYVHFLVSAMLFIAALTWIAGGRGAKDLVLFPVVITVVLYGLFALLLKVPI